MCGTTRTVVTGGAHTTSRARVKEVLADVISQHEQQAFLQEDNAKRVEESVERKFSE